MISKLEIRGLRGIKTGIVEGLAPITFLVGPNGSGKSTILEAAGVACAFDAAGAFHALAAREWLGPEAFQYWFQRDASVVAEMIPPGVLPAPATERARLVAKLGAWPALYGRTTFGAQITLDHTSNGATASATMGHATEEVDEDGNLARPPSSLVPFALQAAFVDRPAGARTRFSAGRFSSALRDALSAVKLSPWYDDLVEYLQVLRPEIASIESIALGERDEPFVFVKNPAAQLPRGFPLAYAGDGFRRSLLLAATLARAKGGVAAFDEPEAYAHPRMFDVVAGLFDRALSDGTQVLVATHSLEFVSAVLKHFQENREQVCVVGVFLEEGQLNPLVVPGKDAHTRVLEWKDDLRL